MQKTLTLPILIYIFYVLYFKKLYPTYRALPCTFECVKSDKIGQNGLHKVCNIFSNQFIGPHEKMMVRAATAMVTVPMLMMMIPFI